MYTIGQVSELFQLPVSTLRYYDKEGLFPEIKRSGGIRHFDTTELEALRLVECLKKTGMEIKNIKQFMQWCTEGSETYPKRLKLIQKQKLECEKEIKRMEKALAMLKFKCWYYETALADGNEDRIHEMMSQGLVDEVRQLKDMGCRKGMTSMQGLGYKEILEYLDGECSLEDAVYTLKRDTRHFAKRQLTWFRRESEVTWIDKGRFDYNEEKILEYMIRELGEKEIYEKQ